MIQEFHFINGRGDGVTWFTSSQCIDLYIIILDCYVSINRSSVFLRHQAQVFTGHSKGYFQVFTYNVWFLLVSKVHIPSFRNVVHLPQSSGFPSANQILAKIGNVNHLSYFAYLFNITQGSLTIAISQHVVTFFIIVDYVRCSSWWNFNGRDVVFFNVFQYYVTQAFEFVNSDIFLIHLQPRLRILLCV